MGASDVRRAAERESDPNERFPAGPRVEWVSAAELKPGDEVLQLKLIYEVVESGPAEGDRGLWSLSLGNPRDYREGFRIDKLLPRERKLALAGGSLYRRLVRVAS
jgi:intein/homing endonuclease